MTYRVVCLFYTCVHADDAKKKGDPPAYSFIVRFREDKRSELVEAHGLGTTSLYAIGVERLNTESIMKTLSSQFTKGGFDLVGITNVVTTVLSERFTARTAVALVQVHDSSFRERLPESNKYLWLPWEEATKWFFEKKMSRLVYDAMKNTIDRKILPLRNFEDGVVRSEDVYKSALDSVNENQKFLLYSAQLFQAQIHRLHEIFVETVFPDCVMNQQQFDAFMSTHEMRSGDDLKALFRAFNIAKERGLTFHDFLHGLAAVQPTTEHGKTVGDIRCRYIFRYFAADCDAPKVNVLKRSELKSLLDHIRNKAKIRPEPRDEMELMSMDPLTVHKFIKLAGSLKIRGTSSLLRMRKGLAVDWPNECPQPLVMMDAVPYPEKIDRKWAENTAIQMTEYKENTSTLKPKTITTRMPSRRGSTKKQPTERELRGDHPDDEITVNPFVLKASLSGTCVNELITVENAGDVSIRATNEFDNMLDKKTNNLNFVYHRAEPRMIDRAFSFLNNIRYFCRRMDVDQGKKAYSWANMNVPRQSQPRDYFLRSVISEFVELSALVATVLFNEERCLKLKGSVRIFSDLCGKLDDLKQFEKCFFPLGVDAVNSQFVFLGNNMRGQMSFEVIGYLFALKVLFPHKIFLIRGVHEFKRTLQEESFAKEILSKFPDANVNEIILSLTRAFDNMPLCAIVNKKIFCSTGGIPHPDTYKESSFFDQIALFPKLLSEQVSEHRYSLPCQILFNEFAPFAMNGINEDFDESGFALFRHRLIYNEEALTKFLSYIGCTHFVRGGKVTAHGIHVECSGRMLCITSSSHHLTPIPQRNEASCLIVNDSKIRIFTVARNPR